MAQTANKKVMNELPATPRGGKSDRSEYKPDTSKHTNTRSNRKQAQKIRRQQARTKKKSDKKRRRKRQNKKVKNDQPGSSIWEKLAEDRIYARLREIGDTEQNIEKFQRKRVLLSLAMVFVGVFLGILIHKWLFFAAPALGFFIYKMQAKKVDRFYVAWKFQRQLNFSKFMRLVIPYLKASGGNTALYTIFNKILQRTNDQADRNSLYRLMGEMGDDPTSIQPFLDYAERSSGTDMSYLFMSTIFDFQQSTFDVGVIDELGELASQDMMDAVDEIIAMKLKRFQMFPTKIVMSSFIVVAGLGAGMLLNSIQDVSGMGGGVDSVEVTDQTGQMSQTDQAQEDAADAAQTDNASGGSNTDSGDVSDAGQAEGHASDTMSANTGHTDSD